VADFVPLAEETGLILGLPSPTLKIDRSFVSGLGTLGPAVDVIRALVTLAQALGMTVSAEGLETEQQVTAFRELACDYGQGHYFSRALDAARARELVRAERAVTPG